MKTAIIILALLLSFGGHAQRLLPGQKGAEIGTGLLFTDGNANKNYYFNGFMTVVKRNGNYQFFGLEYGKRTRTFEAISIPLETFLAEGGYSLCLLGDWNKNISLNLGISATGGYELINRGEKLLSNGAVIQNEDRFIYGGGIRLTLETYLGSHLVLIVKGKTRYLMGTTLERLRPAAGVGLRWIF